MWPVAILSCTKNWNVIREAKNSRDFLGFIEMTHQLNSAAELEGLSKSGGLREEPSAGLTQYHICLEVALTVSFTPGAQETLWKGQWINMGTIWEVFCKFVFTQFNNYWWKRQESIFLCCHSTQLVLGSHLPDVRSSVPLPNLSENTAFSPYLESKLDQFTMKSYHFAQHCTRCGEGKSGPDDPSI